MADIQYNPTTWADGSSGGTSINASRLNNIEKGISDTVKQTNANSKDISTLRDSVSQSLGGMRLATGTTSVTVPAKQTKSVDVGESAVAAAAVTPLTANSAVTCTAKWDGGKLVAYVHNASGYQWQGAVQWIALKRG